ncbi:MAG: hypothetical protein EGR83_21950 [Bacteroides cellulosilyticus]|nr:hypothetical protein [Bacteroides cellulosilyticus]
MANFCHCDGKVLPSLWQGLANTVAELCQYSGKNSLLYAGISGVTIRNLLHKHQIPVSGLLRTS